MAVDRSGNIFIADKYNHRILKVTASTAITSTVAGDYYIKVAKFFFFSPYGVTVDTSGNVFIADDYIINVASIKC